MRASALDAPPGLLPADSAGDAAAIALGGVGARVRAEVVDVVAAVVGVQRVVGASRRVEASDVVQRQVGVADEVYPLGKRLQLTLADLAHRGRLLAPRGAQGADGGGGSAHAAGAAARGGSARGRAASTVRGRDRRALDRGDRRQRGLRLGLTELAFDHVRGSLVDAPARAAGQAARHVAAHGAEVKTVDFSLVGISNHHEVVTHPGRAKTVPNGDGEAVVETLTPLRELSSHRVHLHGHLHERRARAAFARAQDWRMIRRKRVEPVVEAQKAGTTASWQFEMPMRCVSSPQIRLWLTRGTGKHPIRISCKPSNPQSARPHTPFAQI